MIVHGHQIGTYMQTEQTQRCGTASVRPWFRSARSVLESCRLRLKCNSSKSPAFSPQGHC
eukprot:6545979-Prymnesium_polylepis.1